MNRYLKAALTGGVALSAIALSSPVFAQETSASIRGSVVTDTGEALAGATVTITHLPSGTVSRIETNQQGVFFARGLRVGGPYEVRLADGSAYKANSIEDINLLLGQAASVQLVATQGALEEITVTAVRGSTIIKTGAASEFSRGDIDKMTATTRDIKSILRLDPKVWVDPTNSDAISIAGTNSRLNSLTVDGVRQNDDFGLNNNGYPTQRSPISLDAIEQISVQTAPFDVTYGSFQGGNVNIVTKSGTNEFHGGAFYEYSDDNFIGSTSRENTDLVFDFEEKAWGANLGGPIIKDKLMFFVSYEEFESSKPYTYGTHASNASNPIYGVTDEDVARVVEIAQSVYGYDALGLDISSIPETDRKILAKVDWNITEDHRFSATYQNTDGNVFNPQNSFGGSNTSVGNVLTGTGGLGLLSNGYDKSDKLETFSFQLFSDWSDNLSSEIKVGLKDVTTTQAPLGGYDFAQMEIETGRGGSIFIGPDVFRHANELGNDAINVKAKVDYVSGAHLLTAGYEMDSLDIYNLFNPYSNGQYHFASIDDFEDRVADRLFYSNAYTNVKSDAAASFKFQIHTLYLQDRWTPSDNLTLFAGVRYERYANSDVPNLNENFVDRNGFANTENLDGKDILLPRIGFNLMLDDRTTMRGGVGLFAGGSPNVWVSNSYSNDGVILDTYTATAPVTNVDGFQLPASVLDSLMAGDGNVNAIDPDFKIPSVWKFNLAVEHIADLSAIGIGDDWRLAVEAIFGETKDAVEWKELRREVIGHAPDGRPIYSTHPEYDLLLTNTEEGQSIVVSGNINKTWDTEAGIFDIALGYAYQDIEDVNPGQSSTASSNYGYTSTFDRNNRLLATSDFERQHNFTANFNWSKMFWDDNETNLNLFFSTRSGAPFSYTFDDAGLTSGSPFGGSYEFWRRDSQLFYVPTGPNDPNVTYAAGFDTDAFFDFLQTSGLSDYAGEITPRNGFKSPWVSRLDLRLSQEIPVPFLEGHKVRLYFDIDNLTNLIDNDWGRYEQIPFAYANRLVRASIVDGQYVYSNFFGGDAMRFYDLPSLWKMKFGIAYKF